MRYTVSVLVENRAGVLPRISGLSGRRAFSIESFAAGVTGGGQGGIPHGDGCGLRAIKQAERQMNKLTDVIKVRVFSGNEIISRELTLIKVTAPQSRRAEIMNILKVMDARVAGLSKNTMTAEICAEP